MKQKLFTLLLAFIAAISFAGAADLASGSFKNGGTWRINDQGELYIDAVTVPDYKKPENAPWYNFASKIKSVRFGTGGNSDATLTIGTYAFSNIWGENYKFSKVTFDSRTGNVVIHSDAFSYCSHLGTFDFSYVVTIGEGAFVGCSTLSSNEFPRLVYAEDDAFNGCVGLARRGSVGLGSIVPGYSDALKGFRPLADMCKEGVTDGKLYKYAQPNSYGATYILTNYGKVYMNYIIRSNSSFEFVVPADKLSAYQNKFGQHPYSMNNVCFSAGGSGWRLRPDGNMTISLTALATDFANPSDRPWHAVRSQIKEVTTTNREYYQTVEFGKNVFYVLS